jgi:type I restriction enzyme, S subunit
MGGERWPIARLGDKVDLLTGYPFKSQLYVENTEGIKLLRGDNIAQGTLRWDGVKRWPSEILDGLSQYELKADDVILAMDRPWIEAGLKYAAVSGDDLPALLVQRVARLRGRNGLDTRFLRYVIGSPQFTNHVLAVQTGTAVPHISGKQIKSFEFALPPIPEQRAIAAVLGAFDDKIELNRRMNATLEGLARALFKSWFVDFDPVWAKMAGRPTGLPPEIDALFPDELVDSALGEVPKGWEIGEIRDLGTVICGKTPPTSNREFYGDDIPFITIPDMHGKTFVTETGKYLSQAGAEFQKNKFLPPDSVCVSCIATPGLVVLTTKPSQTNQQINSIIPNGKYPGRFSFFLMERMGEKIRSSGSGGSVYHNLSKGRFETLKILLPTSSSANIYCRIESV